MLGPTVQIGEVASAATTDADFFPEPLGMIDHQHAAPTLPDDACGK